MLAQGVLWPATPTHFFLFIISKSPAVNGVHFFLQGDIDREVAQLLSLKDEYKTLTGEDLSGGGKKEKKKDKKQDNVQQQPKPAPAAATAAEEGAREVKKVTR